MEGESEEWNEGWKVRVGSESKEWNEGWRVRVWDGMRDGK